MSHFQTMVRTISARIALPLILLSTAAGTAQAAATVSATPPKDANGFIFLSAIPAFEKVQVATLPEGKFKFSERHTAVSASFPMESARRHSVSLLELPDFYRVPRGNVAMALILDCRTGQLGYAMGGPTAICSWPQASHATEGCAVA